MCKTRPVSVRSYRVALAFVCAGALLAFQPLFAATDSDGDNVPDSIETELGTMPNDPGSFPSGTPVTLTNFPTSSSIVIALDFKQTGNDSLTLQGEFPVGSGFTAAGVAFAIDIGGVVRSVTASTDDGGTNGDASLTILDSPTGNANAKFILFSVQGDLRAIFDAQGLTNSTETGKQITLDATLFVNSTTYTQSLNGFYTATAGDLGSGVVGANIFPPGKEPQILVSEFLSTPNPSVAGQPVKVTLKASFKNLSPDDVVGLIDFDDGTTQEPGDNFLTEGITHTYAADGVYQIRLTASFSGGFEEFVIVHVVGKGSAVNPVNGLVSKVSVADNGDANLNIRVNKLPGADDASTEFTDTDGTPFAGAASAARGVTSRETLDGLILTRSTAKPGMTVATSTAKNTASGEARGKVRKTYAVSSRQTGDSGALPPPPSAEVSGIKVKGKFIFVSDKPDQVSFQGEIQLPAGFTPSNPNGNRFLIGMGNVVDGVLIDAKGKPLNKSKGDQGRLSKVSIKFPKLPGGVAVGGEKAKVSCTMTIPNMDALGFDTEGITPQLREDEQGQKAVSRMMQLNLLLNGVVYESYVPMLFKVSTKKDSGQIATRQIK